MNKPERDIENLEDNTDDCLKTLQTSRVLRKMAIQGEMMSGTP